MPVHYVSRQTTERRKRLEQERLAQERAELEAQGLTVYQVAVRGYAHSFGGTRLVQVAAESIDEAKARALRLPNVASLSGFVFRLTSQPTMAGLA
jgi:hypothetical protein